MNDPMKEDPKYAGYSFCESTTGIGPWHIRKLSPVGRKLGGGMDTPSLCKMVQPFGEPIPNSKHTGLGGWDLNVNINNHHLKHCCKGCRVELLERTK